MFCINCGKQLEDGSRFCPYCGAKVPDPGSYQTFEYPNPTGVPSGGPAGNPDASTPSQPQNPEGADQGQTGAGYWSQPDNSDSGQSGSGFQSQSDAGYWGQSGSTDPSQSGSGFQSQPGAGYWGQSGSTDPSQSGGGFQGQQGGYQNQNKGGFDPWAMKGSPAQTGTAPQADPWNVGGAAGPAGKPKKKKHTVRNVILIVLGVVVLALVGLYILGSTVMGKYEPIIDSYLSYAEDGDTQRVESLFHPAVVESYSMWSSQADGSDVLLYLDSWTDNYGMTVDRYEIAEVDQEEDELEYFNDMYGLKATSYVDVTADVFYENGRYTCMDFDMVEIDGSWYLVYIW